MNQADAFEVLKEAYRTEVAKRGMLFLEDENIQRVIKTAYTWLTGNYKPGLILYGGIGSGKTTLMRAIAEVIRLKTYSAISSEQKHLRIVSALDIMKIAKDTPAQFEELKNRELLGIDDLGIEDNTVKVWGNDIAPILEIMYYRYDRRMFTIITTNLDDEGLTKRYEPRVSDRMREMFDKIACTSESYRK